MKKVCLALVLSTLVGSAMAVPGLIQCFGSFTKNSVDSAEQWALDTDIRLLSHQAFDDNSKDVVLGTLLGNINNYETVYGTTGKGWRFNEYTYAYYEGYMFLEKGKTYSAFTHFDDGASVAINGQYLYNGNQGYNKENWESFQPYEATFTGWHKFQAMAFQGFGGVGKRTDIPVVCGMQWTDVDPDIATNDLDNAEYWHKFVDPGDGSLFITEVPLRDISIASWSKGTDAYDFILNIGAGNPATIYTCYGDQDNGTELADWSNKVALEITGDEQVLEMTVPLDAAYARFVVYIDGSCCWSPLVDLSLSEASQIVSNSSTVLDGDKAAISASTQFASGVDSAEIFVTYWVEGSDEKFTSASQTLGSDETFATTLEGLTPESTYVYTVTIKDSLGNEMTTAESSFTTPGASILISTKGTRVDGRYYDVGAYVGELGAGDTYLVLYVASTNLTNSAGDSRLVYEYVDKMIVDKGYDNYYFEDVFSKWGDYFMYKIVCSNECAGVVWTSQSTPAYIDNSRDNKSTYIWDKNVSSGYWTNSVNWSNSNTGDAYIFPHYGAKASFVNCDNVAVTSIVTQTIGGMGEKAVWPLAIDFNQKNLDVCFVGDYGDGELHPIDGNMYRIYMSMDVNMQSDSTIKIDNCWLYGTASFNYHKSNNATNCTVFVTNQGVFDNLGVFRANNVNSKIILEKNSIGYFSTLELSSTGTELIIDDSSAYIHNTLYMNHWSQSHHTNDDGGVPRVVFRGKNAKLYMQGSLRVADNNDSDDSKLALSEFVFEIPTGGYAETPVTKYRNNSNYFLSSSSKTNLLIRVDHQSPAYVSPSPAAKVYDHQLIFWDSTGSNPIDTNLLEFAALPNPSVNYYYYTFDNTDAREGEKVSGIWVHLEPCYGTTITIR